MFRFTHISFAYGNDVTMQRSKLGKFISNLTIRLTDGIICDYPGLAKVVSAKGGRKVVSIPMGAIFPPETSKVPPKDPHTIVSVLNFNLAYWKGVDILLRAMVELPQAYLILVGDGTFRGPMVDLTLKLGLQERVTFTGHITKEELRSFLQASSIFVLATRTSFHEGTNRATLEAMYYGLPVVVTRVGGLPDLVQDDVNGIVIPPEDQPALIGALMRLLTNHELRERLGRANREKAAQYSAVKMTLARHIYLSSFMKQ